MGSRGNLSGVAEEVSNCPFAISKHRDSTYRTYFFESKFQEHGICRIIFDRKQIEQAI